MILWKSLLVTTATAVVAVSGRASQQADTDAGLVKENGELSIGQLPETMPQILDGGLEKNEDGSENINNNHTDELDNNMQDHLNDLDNAGTQFDSVNGLVGEQDGFGKSIMADSDNLDGNLLDEQNKSDDEEISTDTAGPFNYQDKRSLSDFWETIIAQNRSCAPTISCTQAGGHCFTSGSSCNGIVDAFGCIGGRCMCCIPHTSPALTTSRDVTDTTSAPSTTPIDITSTVPATSTNVIDTTPVPSTTPILSTKTTFTTPTYDDHTTETSTTSSTGCHGGFLVMGQCFKMFSEVQRTWESAIIKCRSEGLILAEPSDRAAAPLREYVLKNFGTGSNFQSWLGARGDGTKFVWQHRGGFLFNNNTLWDTGYLSNVVMSTRYCLELDALQGEFQRVPEKPYDAYTCIGSRWTLCEDISSSSVPPTSTDVTDTSPAPSTTPIGPTTPSNLSWIVTGSDRFVRFPQLMNWTDARLLCRSVGLDVYQPRGLLSLSKYLSDNFASHFYWVGARGNGTHMVWLSGEAVKRSDPWYDNRYTYMNPTDCLYYYANAVYYGRREVLWSWRDSCSRDDLMFVLCG